MRLLCVLVRGELVSYGFCRFVVESLKTKNTVATKDVPSGRPHTVVSEGEVSSLNFVRSGGGGQRVRAAEDKTWKVQSLLTSPPG